MLCNKHCLRCLLLLDMGCLRWATERGTSEIADNRVLKVFCLYMIMMLSSVFKIFDEEEFLSCLTCICDAMKRHRQRNDGFEMPKAALTCLYTITTIVPHNMVGWYHLLENVNGSMCNVTVG